MTRPTEPRPEGPTLFHAWGRQHTAVLELATDDEARELVELRRREAEGSKR